MDRKRLGAGNPLAGLVPEPIPEDDLLAAVLARLHVPSVEDDIDGGIAGCHTQVCQM